MKIRFLRAGTSAALTVLIVSATVLAQSSARSSAGSVAQSDLKEWLTYIASDELQGRQVYTEGLGLASAYIADHLKAWGIKPGGDGGTYFQTVKVLGISTKSRSTVTVTVNGESKTFKDGEGVRFSKNQGGKQTLTAKALFAGYGLTIPEMTHDDYNGRDASGKIVLYIGQGPQGMTPAQTRVLFGRGRNAIELQHAVAAIGQIAAAPTPAGAPPTPPAAVANRADFQSVQRLDAKVAPVFVADDDFFSFVFSASGQSYPDLKAMAGKREALPAVSLDNVSITINVDADYDVVQTRLTRNVVGVIDGSDASVRDTYVLFGAHYDHIGYQQNPPNPAMAGGNAGSSCTGQARPTPRPGDIIFNGADDDGSGTVSLMAVAKAFATGPKPKRSVMFVWHAGEEAGLLGSRYMADFTSIPPGKVAAALNIDMVGRNRCDDPAEANTVYLVGSDRISTELHNVSEEANAAMRAPMVLDYEMNDPADPESLYTRSDHYSYAVKGIPVIFCTTGLHKDYHYLTDEVERIEFPKMANIAQLVYVTGTRVANLDHLPARDNKGPRKGKGQRGKI